MEPHASFTFIDVATGHVIRRMAAKGQMGVVADGRYLWSLSDTGVTRTTLGPRPVVWSNGIAPNAMGDLPAVSAWTPNGRLFYLRADAPKGQRLAEVSLAGDTRFTNTDHGFEPAAAFGPR